MPVSRPYKIGLLQRLKDPEYAAAYLNAAQKDGVFLLALRDVAEAHKISKVAEGADVNRESLYRTLSSQGNPTLTTLDSILGVLGLERRTAPKVEADVEPTSGKQRPTHSGRSHRRKLLKKQLEAAGQLRMFSEEKKKTSIRVAPPAEIFVASSSAGYAPLKYAGIGEMTPRFEWIRPEPESQIPAVPIDLLISASAGAFTNITDIES
jgi:probable addiction module antidote protein